MDISAFLSLPMAKKKEKGQLRTVDEDAIATPRYVRLGKDMRQALRTMRVERMLSLDPLTMDKHSPFWMVACELEGGSGFAARMSQLTTGKSGGAAPMILRLHVPEGVDSPRGVLVRGLVNPRWASLENPSEYEQ